MHESEWSREDSTSHSEIQEEVTASHYILFLTSHFITLWFRIICIPFYTLPLHDLLSFENSSSVFLFVHFLLCVLFCINECRTFHTASSGKGLFFFKVMIRSSRIFCVHRNKNFSACVCMRWTTLFIIHCLLLHMGLLPSPPSVTSLKAHIVSYPHVFCHVSFFELNPCLEDGKWRPRLSSVDTYRGGTPYADFSLPAFEWWL